MKWSRATLNGNLGDLPLSCVLTCWHGFLGFDSILHMKGQLESQGGLFARTWPAGQKAGDLLCKHRAAFCHWSPRTCSMPECFCKIDWMCTHLYLCICVHVLHAVVCMLSSCDTRTASRCYRVLLQPGDIATKSRCRR